MVWGSERERERRMQETNLANLNTFINFKR